MTDVIKPMEQPSPDVQSALSEPQPEMFTEIKPENIEAMKYLGLTNPYDEETMGKINEITEFLGSGDLQEIDLKLGNPHNLTKLDKIYSYIGLLKQSINLQSREAMLRAEREKYTQ